MLYGETLLQMFSLKVFLNEIDIEISELWAKSSGLWCGHLSIS